MSLTQPFNVGIDPRVAADGVTVADLQEQFKHNMRMRELVTSVNQLATRVREAQNRLRTSGGDPAAATRLTALAAKVLTEPVRYGKPGIQAHITYLASMTANVDQKIERDAIERYEVLKTKRSSTPCASKPTSYLDQIPRQLVASRSNLSLARKDREHNASFLV